MARRKYVEIDAIVEKANQYLRVSRQDDVSGRQTLQVFVESLLHETGNYNGFRYLRAAELDPEFKPGIIFDESPAHAHTYPDETRRAYYLKAWSRGIKNAA